MYTEHKIINGRLMFRSSPNGPWRKDSGPVADIVNNMLGMTKEDRLMAMKFFCNKCGTEEYCRCAKDASAEATAAKATAAEDDTWYLGEE
jgi:hypothetical protein